MAVSGYSGTPLIKRLGITPETKILLINPPANYYQLLESNLNSQLVKNNGKADLIHLFARNNKEFEEEMKKLKPIIRQNTSLIIWVSWYKKSSKIPTDLTEDIIRNYALKNDLVDVKVCAVNEIWSGLKLVVPLGKR